jgi:large subunit ribosomal protein L24
MRNDYGLTNAQFRQLSLGVQYQALDSGKVDTANVFTGPHKGKQLLVLRVFLCTSKVLVEHVMMVKKNVRPNPQRNIKGGIAKQESPIAISNVMVVCPSCGPSGGRG